MSLSSGQLDAFFEVTQCRNFSRAAKNLGLTQPALSQRILNLEYSMGVTLLIRETTGVRLTVAGEKLLRYCQTKVALEKEILEDIDENDPTTIRGEIRIGTYSSVFRSVIVPALDPMMIHNPELRITSLVRETYVLPRLLKSCEADFVVLDHEISQQGIESRLLGHETYILASSKRKQSREDVFLDHDPEDEITTKFLKRQGLNASKIERSFMNDIYGIIDGVERGWGVAVLPMHLIADNPKIKIIKSKRDLRLPVYLCFQMQPFYTNLHRSVVETLTNECRKYL